MALPRLLAGSRAPLMVAVIALIAAAAGLFTLPVLDRDEARFAQATAQMLETGNFIEIFFLEDARHKKPIGIYWLQAAAVAATTGEAAREIWAYRLPSLLGAVLTAVFTYAAAARLFGRTAGLAGAGMLAASIVLGAEGGIAKTDAMLAATCAAAFWAIIELRLARSRPAARGFALALWIAMGVGVLIKGPITPVAAGLAVGALVIWERRLDWAWPLLWWPGPLAAIVLVAPWLIAVEIATGGAFIREAFLGDMGPKMVSGHESHGAPPGVHLALLPILLAPAMLTLPAGLRAAGRRLARGGRGALAVKLALCFALPLWMVFEIAPTKLPHYVLPAYPALAAIAGLGVLAWPKTPLIWKLLGAGLGLLGFIGGVAVFAGLVEVGGAGLITTLSLAGGVLILAVVGLGLGLRGRTGLAVALLIASGLAWHGAGRGFLAPRSNQAFVSIAAAELAARFQDEVGAERVISSFTEPSFAFTLGGEVIFLDPDALAASPLNAPAVIAIDVSRIDENAADLPNGLERRRAWLETLSETACLSDAVAGVNYSRGPDPIVIAVYALCAAPEPPADPEMEPTP